VAAVADPCPRQGSHLVPLALAAPPRGRRGRRARGRLGHTRVGSRSGGGRRARGLARRSVRAKLRRGRRRGRRRLRARQAILLGREPRLPVRGRLRERGRVLGLALGGALRAGELRSGECLHRPVPEGVDSCI